jgi:sigma-B regulation protein RsbU (phosphoserine phosphatase)
MTPSVPWEQLRSALGFWLPWFGVATISLAAGLGALVLSTRRRHERLLLFLGIFAALYGLRLFGENGLIRIALGLGSSRQPVLVLTYLIPVPFALFFVELLGSGWKSSLKLWLYAQIAFAPLAIAILFTTYSGLAGTANGVLIIGGSLLVLGHLFADGTGKVPSALRICIVLFLCAVLANNLGFHPGGQNLEPLGFLILIIGLAAVAVQRAMSHEQRLAVVESELNTARRIQTAILPKTLPDSPALRITASWRPMTEVAGDFYDFLRSEDGSITILVADVSGHGVPAALTASMLKVAFAQQAAHTADPAAILSGLNAILHGTLDGQFVTAACAHIDAATREITYAGAGHPPAVLVRPSGEIIELAENGLFLGPFRHASYSNTGAEFRTGDRLILYTDGILEATLADGEPFGIERLRDFLLAEKNSPIETLADRLMNTVSLRGREDDLTVVVTEAR